MFESSFEQPLVSAQMDERDAWQSAGERLAIAALERRARDDERFVRRDRAGHLCAHGQEPRLAVGVRERLVARHLFDVPRWVQIVAVDEAPPPIFRERSSDRRLSRPRHAHHDDNHRRYCDAFAETEKGPQKPKMGLPHFRFFATGLALHIRISGRKWGRPIFGFCGPFSVSALMVITTDFVDIPSGGGTMRLFVAAPRRDARYPGVIAYSDIFQLTGPMLRVCVRLAGYGYVVAAPEIYHRLEPPGTAIPFDDPGRERGLKDAERTRVAEFDADCRATLDYLAAHPRVAAGPLGALGFCIGGPPAVRG